MAFEISKIPDDNRKKELNLIDALANDVIQVNADIAKRANEFEGQGLQAFDALHLASKARKIRSLRINISSPLVWLNEVLL